MINSQSTHVLRLFMYFLHATVALIISFLPVFYENKGLSGLQIGLLLGLGPFISIFAQPLWGFLSDKFKTVKYTLMICICGMIAMSTLIFTQESFLAFLIVGCFFFSFMSPTGALGDSLSQQTAEQRGITFGSIRMWGSIGFATAALISGKVLSMIGLENILYVYLTYAVSALCICFFIKDVKKTSKTVGLMDAIHLRKNSPLIFFLLLIVLISVTHRMNDSYLGIYIKELGGTETLIGWAWFIGVASEAIVFATSGLWSRRTHELNLIALAGFIYGVRFLAVSLMNEPVHILYLQPLHGITFGIFYVSAFRYVSKMVPRSLQATGHLLLMSVIFGFSGIIGALGGGAVIEYFGGGMLYRGMGYLALLGGVCILMYQKLRKGKNQVEGSSANA